jgi:hypothetical protein
MPQFNLPHLWPSDFQMEQFSQRHCSFWSSNAQLKSLGAQGNPAAVSAPLKNSKPKRWPSHESPKTAAMGLLGQQEQLQQIFGKTTEIELYIIKYVYIYICIPVPNHKVFLRLSIPIPTICAHWRMSSRARRQIEEWKIPNTFVPCAHGDL